MFILHIVKRANNRQLALVRSYSTTKYLTTKFLTKKTPNQSISRYDCFHFKNELTKLVSKIKFLGYVKNGRNSSQHYWPTLSGVVAAGCPNGCNIQQCWELLANNVASVCTGLSLKSCQCTLGLVAVRFPPLSSSSFLPFYRKFSHLVTKVRIPRLTCVLQFRVIQCICLLITLISSQLCYRLLWPG